MQKHFIQGDRTTICLTSRATPSRLSRGHGGKLQVTAHRRKHFLSGGTPLRPAEGCRYMHLGEGAAKNGHNPVCAPLPGREMSPAWGYKGRTASWLTKGCFGASEKLRARRGQNWRQAAETKGN